MKNYQLLLFVGLILSCISFESSAEVERIEIDYHHKDQSLSIKQCFQDKPTYIEAKGDHTVAMTSQMTWRGQPVKYTRGFAYLSGEGAGCLEYKINSQNINQPNQSQRFKQQHPNSLLFSIDAWLWQRNDQRRKLLPQVQIRHDSHIQVSAPWKLIKRTANLTQYQMKPSPRFSDGYMAFGPLEIRSIQLGRSKLRLAIMQGMHKNKGDLIEQWVTEMAGSVAEVGETFPLQEVQVLVILINGQGGVVPWGQVNRAGGQGVLFVVNSSQSKQKLFDDWTAAHEFSHLLTPYTPNDRWLSEGFASYHQNISRLRTGLLDEKTAWSKLIAGFDRGHKSASKRTAPKLKKADRKHNMQMYWGGAVIALKADVILQEHSQGRMNLSKALAGLQDCCLDTGKGWTARALFTELDRITKSNVFINLYDQEVQRKSYPSYHQLLKDLGVEKNYYGEIYFNNEAPKAHIRKQISQG
ncbi:MAG: hypothetical protein ACSHWU_01095 [Marinicella sp.]